MFADEETQAHLYEVLRNYAAALALPVSQIEAAERAAVLVLTDFCEPFRQHGNLARPPRRSRVAWSKRKRTRARRRSA